jgi:uncharacterized protein YndB with AHSA1/START domain
MIENKNQGATDAAPSECDFVITRLFQAPRELVWKAWTDPKHLARWWGPREFTNPVCELDLRPGGAYRIVMRSPEGTDYPMHGFYTEIVPLERLAYSVDLSEQPKEWFAEVSASLPPDTKLSLNHDAIVTFQDDGGGTRVTVRSRFAAPEIRDAMLKMGMNEGWSQSLDRLVGLLAKM